MIPNPREVKEAVVLIKEALQYLDPLDDPIAIESLFQAVEFLSAEVLTHTTMYSDDEEVYE